MPNKKQQLPLATSAVSPSAANAVAVARAVSLVLAPTRDLALQLMRELRSAAVAWLQAAAKGKGTGGDTQMVRGPLPRLLLLHGETADEQAAGPPHDLDPLVAPAYRSAPQPLLLAVPLHGRWCCCRIFLGVQRSADLPVLE